MSKLDGREFRNITDDQTRFRLAWFLQRFFLAPTLYPYTHLFNSTQTIGAHHLEKVKGRSFLVCPNHTSSFDIWMAFEVGFKSLSHFFSTDYYLCGLGAQERLGPAPVRNFCIHAGVLPVDRTKGLEQYALQDAVRLLNEEKKKIACLIYPEGTRSKSGMLAREYKAGVGWIQSMTGVPVVPVYQVGYNQLPGLGRKLKIVIDEPMFLEDDGTRSENPAVWFEKTKKIMDRLYQLENQYHPEFQGKEKIVEESAGKLLSREQSAQAFQDISRPYEIIRSGKKYCLGIDSPKLLTGFEKLGELPALPLLTPGEESFCNDMGIKLPYLVSLPWHDKFSEDLCRQAQESKVLPFLKISLTSPAELEESLKNFALNGIELNRLGIEFLYHPHQASLQWEYLKILEDFNIKYLSFRGGVGVPAFILAYAAKKIGKIFARISAAEILESLLSGASQSQVEEIEKEVPLSAKQLSELRKGTLFSSVILCPDTKVTAMGKRLDEKLIQVQRLLDGTGVAMGIADSHASPAFLSFMGTQGSSFTWLESSVLPFASIDLASGWKNALIEAKERDVINVPGAAFFELGEQELVLQKASAYPLLARKCMGYLQSFDSVQDLPGSDKSFLEKQLDMPVEEGIQEARKDFINRLPGLVRESDSNPRSELLLLIKWLLFRKSGLAPEEGGVYPGCDLSEELPWGSNLSLQEYLEELKLNSVLEVRRSILKLMGFDSFWA